MGYVLVTVGTTKFVELVKELENEKILNLLKSKKYEKLYVQYGSGTVSHQQNFINKKSLKSVNKKSNYTACSL